VEHVIILTFKSDLLFNVNSAAINPGAFGSGEISRVAQIMNKYPDTTIKVIGYTDSTGSEAYESAAFPAAGCFRDECPCCSRGKYWANDGNGNG